MTNEQTAQHVSNDVYTAIAHPIRREILNRLHKENLSVTEMTQTTPLTQSAISQHLSILLACGLVERQRHGRQQIYRLRPQRLREVYDWVCQFRDSWE